MASWHLKLARSNQPTNELFAFWADNRKNGAVKKACPNFPLLVPYASELTLFQKHLKRCGRKNKLDHSLFLLVEDKKFHLFNANQRSIELYLTLWGCSLTNLGLFSIEPNEDETALNFIDIYSKKDYALIRATLNRMVSDSALSTPEVQQLITSQIASLDDAYKHEDKFLPKPPKPLKSKAKAKAKKAKNKKDDDDVLTNGNTSTPLPERPINRRRVSSKKRSSLPNEERESYVPNEKAKCVTQHVNNKPLTQKSYIERHCGAPKNSASPRVSSSIKIDKRDHFFALSIPSKHRAKSSKHILCDELFFKTRSGAKAAIKALENKNHERTDATLYITKRSGDEKDLSRTFFPLVGGNDQLIDAILEDWGGTPLGYSLHKAWDFQKDNMCIKPLHQSELGMDHLRHLLDSGECFNLSLGMSPSISM